MSRFIGVLFLVLVCSSFKIDKVFSVFGKSTSDLQAVNWPYTVVTKGTWTINSLTLQQTPARNSNNAITLKATANDYIEFSKVDINVKLNGLFLHSETVNFNETFDQGDSIQFNYTNFVPSFAPAGTYLITFSHKEKSGKENGVWSMTFKL